MKKKLLSIALAFIMLISVIPMTVFAEAHTDEVHVIVENTTFTPETAEKLEAEWNDSFWYGTLVDEWVTIDDNSTMMSCIVAALDKNDYEQEGAEYNYISSINGLSANDGGWMSGWMGTLNDWFTNAGFGDFTVANGGLEAGDEICVMYTCNGWGADLGGTWGDNNTTLKSVKFSEGTLSPAFDPETTEYVLSVPKDTKTVYITPTAANKNFLVRTRIGDTVYKRTADVPVSHGTEIIIECNYEGAPTMNTDCTESHTYTITVEDEGVKANASDVEKKINAIGEVNLNSSSKITSARKAYDKLTDIEKTLVTNYDVLTAAEVQYRELLVEDAITKIDAIGTVTLEKSKEISAAQKAYNKLTDDEKTKVTNYSVLVATQNKYYELIEAESVNALDETEKYILENVPAPVVSSIGGEWAVIGLARKGATVPENYYSTYYSVVENYVKENIKDGDKLHNTKSTDNSRVIVALTAIGKDPTDVAGHNLLTPLADLDYVKKQGINGPVWALIALDTYQFNIPTAEAGKTQTTRENLIDYILEKELAAGGWTFSGTTTDPDMTGMAIQALAPYYNKDAEVKAAVDRAVAALSDIQLANGGFATWGSATSESTSQVITALSALGIDADTDSRFIKNGRSAYDDLMSYYVAGGGFRHILDGDINQMATEQAFYALVAYNRMKTNQTALYDMSDVLKYQADKAAAEEVIKKIADIGTVTLSSEAAIVAARTAYTALTDAQKVFVSNYDLLVTAENDLAYLKSNIVVEKEDVKLQYAGTYFPKETVIDVETIFQGSIFETVKQVLNDVANKFVVYEITATSNNVSVQPNGKIMVTFAIPDGYDASRVVVYYVAPDGSKTLLDSKTDKESNTISAEVEHFSTYVVAEKLNVQANLNTDSESNVTSPQTADHSNIGLWFMMMVSAGALMLIAVGKRKFKHEKNC